MFDESGSGNVGHDLVGEVAATADLRLRLKDYWVSLLNIGLVRRIASLL